MRAVTNGQGHRFVLNRPTQIRGILPIWPWLHAEWPAERFLTGFSALAGLRNERQRSQRRRMSSDTDRAEEQHENDSNCD